MKILVVDDHPLVREGLLAILSTESSISTIEQAGNSREAIKRILSSNPNLVLLDLRLGKECGLDMIPKVRDKGSNCKFVVLTCSSDQYDFKRAESLGVDGYILKTAYPEEILLGIKLVSRGRKYYDPSILEIVLRQQNKGPIEELTARERDVLRELGKGKSNKEIGKQLFITEYTVKKHVSQILAKLDVSDRTQAALYANTHKVV